MALASTSATPSEAAQPVQFASSPVEEQQEEPQLCTSPTGDGEDDGAMPLAAVVDKLNISSSPKQEAEESSQISKSPTTTETPAEANRPSASSPQDKQHKDDASESSRPQDKQHKDDASESSRPQDKQHKDDASESSRPQDKQHDDDDASKPSSTPDGPSRKHLESPPRTPSSSHRSQRAESASSPDQPSKQRLKEQDTPSNSNDTTAGPSTPQQRPAHDRRHSSREYKETLDAHTSDEKDGTRVINQYHLVRILGQGAYGVVYEARLRTDSSQIFAVKEFSKTRLRKSRRYEKLRKPALRGRGLGRTSHGRDDRSVEPSSSSKGPEQNSNEGQGDEDDSDPLILIRREIAIMKKLDHKNVISLIEALDDPSRDELYMVLEHCPDGSVIDVKLHERRTALSEDVARGYLVQILLGLEYLHSNDIIHRDIKPDNILLADNRQTCKIVDFGVSEMFTPQAHKPMAKAKGQGTPAFLSPELCRSSRSSRPGSSGDNPRSDDSKENSEPNGRRDDMWALGVTLYCMVVGHLPFDKSHFLELYEAIQYEEPEYPGHLTKDCVDLLQRFLKKDPRERITVEQAREHPWVTQRGEKPLLPAARNLESVVAEITDDEIRGAISKISSVFTFARAVSKFKRARSRNSSGQSISSTDATPDNHNSTLTSSPQPERQSWSSQRATDSDTQHENGLSSAASFLSGFVSHRRGPSDGSDGAARSPKVSRQPSGLGPITEGITVGSNFLREAAEKALETIAPSPVQERAAWGGSEEATPEVEGQQAAADNDDNKISAEPESMEESITPKSEETGETEVSSGDAQATEDKLSKALEEVEAALSETMRRGDPRGAGRFLSNKLHAAVPLVRLEAGLEGLGISWLTEALGKGKSALESTVGNEEDQPSAEVPPERANKDDGRISPSRYSEDGSGRNLHTGRQTQEGEGSSALKKDKRRTSDQEGDLASDEETPGRIFSGPLIASPRIEVSDRHWAAKFLQRTLEKSDDESGSSSDNEEKRRQGGLKEEDRHENTEGGKVQSGEKQKGVPDVEDEDDDEDEDEGEEDVKGDDASEKDVTKNSQEKSSEVESGGKTKEEVGKAEEEKDDEISTRGGVVL